MAGRAGALLGTAVLAVAASVAVAQAPPPETLKERLSDKASDQQRVDDCKVPADKRGDSKRPAACPPTADAKTTKADPPRDRRR
jgi:hypothetical protein